MLLPLTTKEGKWLFNPQYIAAIASYQGGSLVYIGAYDGEYSVPVEEDPETIEGLCIGLTAVMNSLTLDDEDE